MKVNICIPYYRRENQLKLVLKSLARDSIYNNVEIVIGLGQTCIEKVKQIIPKKFPFKIKFALVEGYWSISKARNRTIQNANGELLLILDCDVVISQQIISRHVDWHNKSKPNQKNILLGFVHGYNKMEEYNKVTPIISNSIIQQNLDRRIYIDIHQSLIPWCLCWTGHLSMIRNVFEEANELFDEQFVGWGMEDQEWGLRMFNKGFSFCMDPDIFGLHIPHIRQVQNNLMTERKNLDRFIMKHPILGVELIYFFGDTIANKYIPSLLNTLKKLYENFSQSQVIFYNNSKHKYNRIAYFGIPNIIRKGNVTVLFDPLDLLRSSPFNIIKYSLLGLRTPFKDKYFSFAFISSKYKRLDGKYLNKILLESQRIADYFEFI
jgi:glycosyltransferase involved in cell wall biosynthesis